MIIDWIPIPILFIGKKRDCVLFLQTIDAKNFDVNIV